MSLAIILFKLPSYSCIIPSFIPQMQNSPQNSKIETFPLDN